VAGAAFSPDGKLAASTSDDQTVALWNASSFNSITTFEGHMNAAFGVGFSPDCRRLATGGTSDRDAVKLWDLATYRELVTLPGRGNIFMNLAFSRDGNWVVARDQLGGQLHLWRAPSWAEIDAAEKAQASAHLAMPAK
jgi:WD40 repeat protein